jgi:glycosyltransferase involved in cell wall biosynthesis
MDTSLWDEPTTGIALATRELVRSLTVLGVPVERWGAKTSGEVPRGRRQRSLWTLARLPALLAERHPALFHAQANFNLPLERVPGVPFVLTVHDLVPLVLPQTVSASFRWQFRLWLTRSLHVADQVICVSETTKTSLLSQFEVDSSRVSVVHHGVDHVDRVPPPDATTVQWLDALGLPDPFVLYAGALDARKNVELVLKACERLFDGGKKVTLVLAGQRWFGAGPVEREVQRLKEKGVDVRALGYLADPVFFALMRRAGVFVFPSRYEGFGLPPLEAMRLGVPTIVSGEGSLPEICGGGAMLVGVDDELRLAQTIERLMTDGAEREVWRARARARAAEFTWEAAARKTLDVYRRVAELGKER